jgi:hypothetical protein
MSRKAKRGRSGSATTTIGGAMAGFEEQVFKALPRIEELVRRGQDVRGLAADGSGLSVGFPPDEAPGEVPDASPEPPARPAPPEPNKAARLRPGRR